MAKTRQMNIPALAKEVAEMEADIKTTIVVFAGVIKSLGIDVSEFKDGFDISSHLPKIIGKLTRESLTGSFDTKSFGDITALGPIFSKYQYLTEDIKI